MTEPKHDPDKFILLTDTPLGEMSTGTPTELDGLSFGQYADMLAKAAVDTREAFTIGIYGGWGSGKTSMMHLIQEKVGQQELAVPVWFNAWRFEKEEHLIIPLMATIITELKDRIDEAEKNNGKSLSAEAKEVYRKAKSGFRGAIYGLGIKGELLGTGFSWSAKDALNKEKELLEEDQTDEEKKKKAREAYIDLLVEQSLYFKAFKELEKLGKECGEMGLKIVIFVDDLDRCFPEKAIELLEGIKLVLNQPGITFILGLAPDIISSFLRKKYHEEYGMPKEVYEEYLGKIIQLPFRIPSKNDDLVKFSKALLSREEVFGDLGGDLGALADICIPACNENPRSIIRFLNRLLINKQLLESKDNIEFSIVHIAITEALEMRYTDFLSYIETINEIVDIDMGEKNGKEDYTFTEYLVTLFHDNPKHSGIIQELEDLMDKSNARTSKFFQLLIDQPYLRNLLGSNHGIEWLRSERLRRETIHISFSENYKRGIYIDDMQVNGYHLHPRAYLHGVDLSGEYLSRANLFGADLTKARLQNAILTKANLDLANLQGCNLCGANLKGASIRDTNFRGSKYSSTTDWPEGFIPKKHDCILC